MKERFYLKTEFSTVTGVLITLALLDQNYVKGNLTLPWNEQIFSLNL